MLGLIFLRFEDVRFVACRAQLAKASVYARHCGSQVDQAAAYHAEDVRYLAPDTRFDHLLALPDGRHAGKATNEAMCDIDRYKPLLTGMLPNIYEIFNNALLTELLKKITEIPASPDYEALAVSTSTSSVHSHALPASTVKGSMCPSISSTSLLDCV